MADHKKWVVKIFIEGWMVQAWLSKDIYGNWKTTDDLEKAAIFESPEEALRAIGTWEGLSKPWCLGFATEFKGLSYPNPC